MINALLGLDLLESPSVLCLGAHCDDIEIGCGGTLARIAEEIPHVHFDWVVFSSNPTRAEESSQAARALLKDAEFELHTFDFRDGFLPYVGADAKAALANIAATLSPDLVLTHYANDAHQDHRLVSEITANLFRDNLILEYEVPKYDGDLGRPNVFVALDDSHVMRKVRTLTECFASQAGKHWFSEETFRAILRLRGIEAGRDCNYAEAFYCRKLRLLPA